MRPNKRNLITKSSGRDGNIFNSLSNKQRTINLIELEKCFENFTIFDYNDIISKDEDLDMSEEDQEKEMNNKPKTYLRIDNVSTVLSENDSFDNGLNKFEKLNSIPPYIGKIINDLIPPRAENDSFANTVVAATSGVSTTIPMPNIDNNDVRMTHGNAFTAKKSLTIEEYTHLSLNFKFKICLNFIRYNIFKELDFKKNCFEIGSIWNDHTNIKNILLYQIFKRFERLYSVKNWTLDYMPITKADKLRLIRCVEKVYLSDWHLGEYSCLEGEILQELD